MSFCIDDEKPPEKYKAIQANIEDSKNVRLNALPVYNDRYVKAEIKTLSDKV